MSNHDPGMHLLNCFLRGRIDRRDLFKRAAALGVGASAFGALARLDATEAAAQEASPAGEITWGLSTNVPNIIPFGGIALAQWQGKEFMYDSLLAWDADLNVIPALAESWDTPDDTTYTFKLREGVKFHDGRDMTAKDVVYSFNVALDPPEPGVKVPYLGNVASVEAVDDYNVTIKMTKADPTLSGTLAWTNYTPIVPEGIMDEIEVLSNGIGTGPFKLVEYSQDDQIVYEAFPDFWEAGQPGVQNLTLKMLPDEQQRLAALRASEIHGGDLSADVAQTVTGDDITVLSGLTSAPQVIQFNMVEDVPWRDKRVRQAISLVVDRQEIIDKVYGGKATMTGVIPPGFGIWPMDQATLEAAYTVDVEKAKALMAEAGFADGFDVELQAIAAPRTHTQIAEIVQEAIKQLNINAEVVPLEIGQFADNIGKGTFQWASTARGMRGDPSGHVVDFRSGTANNISWFGDGWKNDELDRIYDEALATVDEAARKELYDQFQAIMLDEMPNMYTVVPEKFQAVHANLQGMYVFYGNTNPGLRTATVTEE
jgi:peptide/nickel transport system substrate-binding protein